MVKSSYVFLVLLGPITAESEKPGRAPGAWVFGTFCLATPEARKGSQVPGQQDPGPTGTPGLGALGAGGLFPHDLGGPLEWRNFEIQIFISS